MVLHWVADLNRQIFRQYESDPRFPNHHPDPVVAANLEDLKQGVLEYGAYMGLAYDGDGDRIGVVDEKGE